MTPSDEEPEASSLARSIMDADEPPASPGHDQVDYPNPMGGFWTILFPVRPRSGSIIPGLVFLGLIALAIVWATIEGL